MTNTLSVMWRFPTPKLSELDNLSIETHGFGKPILRNCQEEMFNRLDSKANGDLTLEQLVDGAKTDPDFQSRLPLG